MRADEGACGPKMRGHRLRNCTKDLILLAHSGEAQARKRRGLGRCLDGFSARSLTGRQGEGRTETRDGKKGTAPKGRALFVGPVFLNKIRVLCLFAGGRSHRRGGFFVRWGRRAPPVPAAAGVNLLRFPRPRRGRGTGGGRGEGCGRKRRGKKDQAADRHGAEQARAPTRRRRGRRSTAPRNGPRAAEGGMAGRAPPCGRWPDRGAAGAAATAQERPASGPAGGAGRRQRTPANGGGCPCAPPCSPRRRPPEGASTGQAGHGAGARAEGAAARRARSCGPPTPRCKKRHPQGTPSGEKGERPGYQSPDALPGDQGVNPLQGYRTTAAPLLSSPRRGRAPLLDNRTLFRHRGPQGPLWPG